MATMTAETVEATCRNGHSHTYAGPVRRSVKCKTSECRVNLWLKVGQVRQVNAGTTDLAALWARESLPDDLLDDAEIADESCPECAGDLLWEGRRTLLYCGKCDEYSVPGFVTDRYEQREEPRSRGAGGGGELAVREQSPAERRQQEAALAGHKETMADTLAKAIGALDVTGLPDSQTRQEAVRWRGSLSSYVSHVRAARTAEELTEIREEILSLSLQYQQVAEDVRQERMRVEQREQAAREYEAQRAALEAQYEADSGYEDVLPGTVVVPVSSSQQKTPSLSPTALAVANGMAYLSQVAEEKRERRETLGECPFRHRRRPIAEYRMFPTYSQWNNAQYPGSPELRVCAKHKNDALEWFGQKGYRWVETEEL